MINISVCGPSTSMVLVWLVTTSNRWTVYPAMIPFWCSNGGGSQLMEIADELKATPATSCGGAVGAVKEQEYVQLCKCAKHNHNTPSCGIWRVTTSLNGPGSIVIAARMNEYL